MSYDRNEINRDGFASGYGRFYAMPDRVERIPGSSLRNMFLPTLHPSGQKAMRDSYGGSFVRGQLKHYGVEFDEKEFTGNGTHLFKKVLAAGKCDKVPDHIAQLCEEMNTEWLNKQTPQQLSSEPKWVIERYFLSSGQPDSKKTITVVGIPFPPRSDYGAGEMREAASKVSGLHQKTGRGSKTQTIFMGWDREAVRKAAASHAGKEAKELKAEEDERDAQRTEAHSDYLNSLKKKKGTKFSIAGSYMIDCEEIEGGWSDVDDLSLDIHQTKTDGIFEADFDFGILEGVMIISEDKKALDQYCSQLDREGRDGDSEEDEDDEEEDEDNVEVEDDDNGEDEDKDDDDDNSTKPAGSKREAKTPRGRGRPPKKAKTTATTPHIYYLKLKCRETGEGQIYPDATDGTLTFDAENLASFTGTADLPCVGPAVPFTGKKVSDQAGGSGGEWADYSDSAYEAARVGRWC